MCISENFMKKLQNKGQGALEYLMIIGAAVAIAVIAVALVFSLSLKNKDTAAEQNEQFDTFIDHAVIPPMVLNVDCNRTANKVLVQISPSPTRGVTKYCLYYNNSQSTCIAPSTNNTLSFSHSILTSDRVKIAISAQKGNAQSAPSSPALDCYPHN